jgi:hypothetical protein
MKKTTLIKKKFKKHTKKFHTYKKIHQRKKCVSNPSFSLFYSQVPVVY